MALPQSDFGKKSFSLGTLFNPNSPINREELFAGRQSQVLDVVDTINQRGQHAVLYGERGVGKTSLANMIIPKLKSPEWEVIVPHVNCMTADDYSGIWKRVFEEIIHLKSENSSFGKSATRILKGYTGPFTDTVTPDAVRRLLDQLGQDRIVVIVLDEFDTVENYDTRSMMSDTLKFLSDRAVSATVILVGVADDVESLIKNHRSLERCLRQIYMPRMSYAELEVIVKTPFSKVGMGISESALDEIAGLSKGLPHYPHLLGLHAGRAALDRRTISVTSEHVQVALRTAIDKAQSSIQTDYFKSITSSREEALYRQVLLACAIAKTDEVGWFYPKDVRAPLEKILGRKYKIEAFARHLHAFSQEMRGPVLIVDKKHARPRFRFENPLMQPYVLIRGIAEGLIAQSDVMSDEDKENRKKQREKPDYPSLFD